MKKKFIVLLSVAICICMVTLVIVQARSLQVAGEMQKESFGSKMDVVLNNIAANVENVEQHTDDKSRLFESVGEKSYRSITGNKQKLLTPTGFKVNEVSDQSFTINKKDIKLISGDKKIGELLADRANLIDKDLDFLRKDFPSIENFTTKAWIDEKKEITVTLDRAIEERLSFNKIDSLIRQEFKHEGINTAYEFAVRDAGNIEIASLSSAGFRSDRLERLYTAKLFPYDSEQAPKYYLSIYVPHLSDYIFKELWLVILSSVLLILIIVGTFAATLIIIFKQKRLSQMRSDFMGNMTHELKTPIATITLASEMLQDPNVPDEKKNISGLSKMIRDEAQRLSSLVEKVLRMAAFERGNINLKHREVNIKQVITKVVEGYALQFNSKKAKVFTQYKAKDNIVLGDEMHLQQIISNLIDNALKYSKTNPEITITTENKKNEICISVSDNGIGIDREYLKHVFEQFYRVPTGNIHSVKGSGLGLNYVKQIAEMHGGEVFAESEKGKGSCFTICLPNKKK